MKTKTFDCVAMKHEIQRRLRTERGGRSWTERNQLIRRAMRKDPHLSRLLDLA
ncbi:MAG: hypothetical protein WBE26_19600 [Phycisphaerae bacterium]